MKVTKQTPGDEYTRRYELESKVLVTLTVPCSNDEHSEVFASIVSMPQRIEAMSAQLNENSVRKLLKNYHYEEQSSDAHKNVASSWFT